MHEPPDGTPQGVAPRFSNPVTQAGFTKIPNAVLLRSDISLPAKVIYGYLGHLAWRSGAGAIAPTMAEIATDLGCSVRALRGYITELRQAPVMEGPSNVDSPRLVESQRRGLGLPNAYVINDPILPDGAAESADQSGGSRRSSRARSLPGVKTLEPRKTSTPISPRPEDRPATVDRAKVTDLEWFLAEQILSAWNLRAGSRLTPKAWAPKIIMRIREHPTLTLQDHAGVIAASLAHPWWSGPANPSVVYGNAAQFERSVLQALAPQQDSNAPMTPEEMETYRKLWGPGTPYSTLAEAKAANALPVIEGR